MTVTVAVKAADGATTQIALADPVVQSGAAQLVATITFPGGSPTAAPLTFDMATGTDMGNYTALSGTFTQRCIRVRNASLPNFFVDFRPDVSGGRIEIVFWNGECMGTVPTKFFRNLPTYNAVVTQNGVPLADYLSTSTRSIPFHYWGTRWRFQSSRRPYIRTELQVFSDKFLPAMDTKSARISGYTGVIVPPLPSLPGPTTKDGKNGDGTAMTVGSDGPIYIPFMVQDGVTNKLLGALCAGDTGGYRQELGLITEWQADWLLRGTASSRNTFMQQAEFMSGQGDAIFVPDQVTGAPVNQKQDAAHYKAATVVYDPYYHISNGMDPITSGGFNGSISGTTLTVSSDPGNGNFITAGMVLLDYSSGGGGIIVPPTLIVSQVSGTQGGRGTYTISKAQTTSGLMIASATSGELKSKGDEHSPNWWYIPWVITEDPYYIEAQQFKAVSCMQTVIYHKENVFGGLAHDATGASGWNGSFTVFSYPGEERMVGWGIKNVAMSYKMTPAIQPSWLLPKSHFAACSSDYAMVIDHFTKSFPNDQYYKVFKSITYPFGDTPQTFYKAYVCYAMGFADFIGLPTPTASGQTAPPTWHTLLDYTFGWFRATSDPTTASGWNCQAPLIHDTSPNCFTNQFGAKSGYCISTGTMPTGNNCYVTWSDAWTGMKAYLLSGSPSPNNPSPGFIQGGSIGNCTVTLGAAKIAKTLGIAGAAGVVTWMDSLIDYSYPQTAFGVCFRCQDGFSGT